jgi:DNA primase
MRALTWQGTGKVSVETVPDPTIQEPTDAIVRMTSTAICGPARFDYIQNAINKTLVAPYSARPRGDRRAGLRAHRMGRAG